MKKNIFYALCIILLGYGWKYASSASHMSILQMNGIQMGIPYQISVATSFPEADQSYVIDMIQSVFEEVDTLYNNWNPHSEISQFNTWPANLPFTPSPKLHLFLQKIDRLVRFSEGRFDPTIGPLKTLWLQALEKGMFPSQNAIEEIRPCLGWEKLRFEGKTISKLDARTQLDFGGVAKGFCVDLCIEALQAAGFQNLFVEWGGEVRCSGQHPSGRPWKVAIVPPPQFTHTSTAVEVELVDAALATSGNYLQQWEAMGRRFTHILDPRTLQPLEITDQSIASATLQATDCITADALSKTLLLFPEEASAIVWIETRKDFFLKCWLLGSHLLFTRSTEPVTRIPSSTP